MDALLGGVDEPVDLRIDRDGGDEGSSRQA